MTDDDSYLFIGGYYDGRVVEIPSRDRATFRQLRTTEDSDGLHSETYTKRLCVICGTRHFFFALNSIDDESAFQAYLSKIT